MSIHSITQRGRRAAEATLVDTCRITRPGAGGRGPFDEEGGTYTTPQGDVVWEGPCRLQVRADINSNVVEVTAGDREWAYQTAILQIPVDSFTADLRVDYTVEILTAAEDPGLVGRTFQIRAIHHKTHAVTRRFRITEAVA